MIWTEKQIEQHKKVAKTLVEIKDLAFDYIRRHKNCTEKGVQEFIVEKYGEFNLVADSWPPIVAFGENTCNVHYYPLENSRRLREGDLVLVDLWARLNESGAPFADITWMAYTGKDIPGEIDKCWIWLKRREMKP